MGAKTSSLTGSKYTNSRNPEGQLQERVTIFSEDDHRYYLE